MDNKSRLPVMKQRYEVTNSSFGQICPDEFGRFYSFLPLKSAKFVRAEIPDFGQNWS